MHRIASLPAVTLLDHFKFSQALAFILAIFFNQRGKSSGLRAIFGHFVLMHPVRRINSGGLGDSVKNYLMPAGARNSGR